MRVNWYNSDNPKYGDFDGFWMFWVLGIVCSASLSSLVCGQGG